jgi:hypothetical protein
MPFPILISVLSKVFPSLEISLICKFYKAKNVNCLFCFLLAYWFKSWVFFFFKCLLITYALFLARREDFKTWIDTNSETNCWRQISVIKSYRAKVQLISLWLFWSQ